MNRGRIALTVSVLLSVMLVVPPLAISAGPGPGRGGGGRGGTMGHVGLGGRGGFAGHVGTPRGFGGRGFHHGRPFFHHRFGRAFPFAFASPAWFYGWPYPYGSYGWPYYYGSALSPDQPAYYGGYTYGAPGGYPSSASSAPIVYSVNIYNPAPAPTQPVLQPAVFQPAAFEPPPVSMGPAVPASPQGVVEYDGGRYELRGDGMTVPYKWVWIPNPPPGPPGSSAMRTPTSGELAPARRGTIYRWVDDQDVLHVTDRWQAVPQRYRAQAKQNLGS